MIMRLMGIDYGTKKIGIALSDESGVMAFPYGVISNSSNSFDEIVQLINEKKVNQIIIGHSLGRDGTANAVQSEIDDLMLHITLHTGLPVHLVPEQYTTQAAIRIQGRNGQTDASAAALILDSFIISKK
jgi:putative Holliday junction resolvase